MERLVDHRLRSQLLSFHEDVTMTHIESETLVCDKYRHITM